MTKTQSSSGSSPSVPESHSSWHAVDVQRAHTLSASIPQIVFHGINKSGSLALANVIRASFFRHHRANQFFSHYHRVPATLEDLIQIMEFSSGPSFFVAHYLYGAFQHPLPGRMLFTQFRHPLPRVVSCYQWLRNKHASKQGSAEDFPTLKEFVRSTGGKKHSQIVQFGVGFGGTPEQRANATKRMHAKDIYERALDAINRDVSLIGLAEHFEETIFIVAHACGLTQVPAWQRDDRNTGRPLVNELPQDVCDLIREVYVYDFYLYDWAKKRFFEQLSEITFGPSLDEYKNVCRSSYKDRLT